MENDEDIILYKLDLISKILVGDKLSIKKDNSLDILIQKNVSFQGLSRWFNGDNRNSTIVFLNSLVSDCDTLVKSILISKNKKIIIKLYSKLVESVQGILNLKYTYMNDLPFVTRIDCILRKLNESISLLQNELINKN